jgi:mono/diheme cytochrome c family protein
MTTISDASGRARIRGTVLAVVATVTLAVAACSGGDSGSDASMTAPKPRGALAHDAELLRGRRVFVDQCARCHGARGEGGIGPSFRTGRILDDFDTADAQAQFVRTGRNVMPGFAGTLGRSDIDAVVRYEREVLAANGAGA